MSLTHSQNLLFNTIRPSIYRKHRLNDLASFLWPHLIILSKNHFHKNTGRGQQEGGHNWYPFNDLTKKVLPQTLQKYHD